MLLLLNSLNHEVDFRGACSTAVLESEPGLMLRDKEV